MLVSASIPDAAGTPLWDNVILGLLKECRRFDVRLHGFALVSGALHFLASMPGDVSVAALMHAIKGRSGGEPGSWRHKSRFSRVDSPRTFEEELENMHASPVKAKKCASPEQYRWSSSWAYKRGLSTGPYVLDAAGLAVAFVDEAPA